MPEIETVRKVEIQYQYFENSANEDLVRTIVEGCRWMLPRFIRRLHIDSTSDSNMNSIASTRVLHEYGLATIEIHDPFWDTTPQMQSRYLRHEMIHVAHGRIFNLVRDRLLAPLKESNPDLYEFCDEEFRERLEEFTEHFTDLMGPPQ